LNSKSISKESFIIARIFSLEIDPGSIKIHFFISGESVAVFNNKSSHQQTEFIPCKAACRSAFKSWREQPSAKSFI